ncbi:ferritin-like domain-containing protein [Massilia sp. Se16.2.3]|uniref:ferritin-like domain-containing protein n=1 Tax=Massilia sp. Se16.2.3 TaxID=2709303 RepID=UPI0015FFFF22|nr:ferritin-like domain-containing protein [Massilia sp. Se16.2.3]
MAQEKEHVGMNKTGVQMSPLQTKAMLDDDRIIARGHPGDETAMAQLRQSYIAEGDNVGSIPMPGTMKGMVSMGVNMLKGDKPQVLLDKLAERLAMERTATRLYDALLTKLAVVNEGRASINLDDVASIRGDEARHALLLRDAITSMGGDPTAMTPSADMAGVEAMGLVQVLNDPRTSLAQSLHAILTAELSDGVGWETPDRAGGGARAGRHGRRFRQCAAAGAQAPGHDPDLVRGGGGTERPGTRTRPAQRHGDVGRLRRGTDSAARIDFLKGASSCPHGASHGAVQALRGRQRQAGTRGGVSIRRPPRIRLGPGSHP